MNCVCCKQETQDDRRISAGRYWCPYCYTTCPSAANDCKKGIADSEFERYREKIRRDLGTQTCPTCHGAGVVDKEMANGS